MAPTSPIRSTSSTVGISALEPLKSMVRPGNWACRFDGSFSKTPAPPTRRRPKPKEHPIMDDSQLILAELERVTESRAFRFADRQRSFLRYVVTETLNKRANRLKEYVIGIEVFGKPTTFDPRLDSIVRTEAHKLRAKLARYFDTEGRSDSIRIDLPRGKYSPAFWHSDAVPATGSTPAPRLPRESGSLRVLVLPFGDPGDRTDSPFGDTLTNELRHALSALPGIEVVARSC